MSINQPSGLSPLPCAWCLVEQEMELGPGSHGICEAHANQLRVAHRVRRERQRASAAHLSPLTPPQPSLGDKVVAHEQ
jgi:hypothetical protein